MEKLTSQEIAALQFSIKQLTFVRDSLKDISFFLDNNNESNGSVTLYVNCIKSKLIINNHLETLNTLLNEQ